MGAPKLSLKRSSDIMISLVNDTNNKNFDAVKSRIDERAKELLHSALGMSSELPELAKAIENNDKVNTKEEIGDIGWYNTLAQLQMAPVLLQVIGETYFWYSSIEDYENGLYSEKEEVPYNVPFTVLSNAIGEFVDLIKKQTFYGKTVSDEKIAKEMAKIDYAADLIANSEGLTLEDCILAVNAKLRKRYEGGYSDSKAINRDVTKEYEVMKNDGTKK